MDANTAGFGTGVIRNGGTTPSVQIGGLTGSAQWGSPSALLFEWNGSSSNIYLGNFQGPLASGTIGAGSMDSLCLGSHSQAFGGGSNWDGPIAEIIVYNRVLGNLEKKQLASYLNARYLLGIVPPV